MRSSLKALVLIGLGLFLYSRFINGSLLFYINERFVWLTFMAVVGLLLIGVSYRYSRHHGHTHAGHTHQVSASALLLLAVPVLLGLLVPPRPLGAAAMSNREVRVGALSSTTSPGNPIVLESKGPKNILDWLIVFWQSSDPASFAGQEADVVGFVYRDGRFQDDVFMASRFVVSCCVADAASVGLVVRWPEAAALATDGWVRVTGRFEPGEFDGEPMPILVADSVTPAEPPEKPYLSP